MATIGTDRTVPRIDIRSNTKLTFALRLILGITLLVFGASKLQNLAGFADTVSRYRVLPETLAVPYGYVLPWVEVTVGIFIIIGLGLKLVAPISIVVIATLIAGTSGSLYVLGVRGPCGCLPGLNWELGTSHLIAQLAMLIIASQIWLHKGEFLSLDSIFLKQERAFFTHKD